MNQLQIPLQENWFGFNFTTLAEVPKFDANFQILDNVNQQVTTFTNQLQDTVLENASLNLASFDPDLIDASDLLTTTDSTYLLMTPWGSSAPASHPMVEAATGDDDIMPTWDILNKKVHKAHEFHSREEAKKYMKALVQKIKDGIVDVKSLEASQKLAFYAISHQLRFGDNNTPEPSIVDVRAHMMWDAWNKMKGTDKKKAARIFMNYVEALFAFKLCPDQDIVGMAEQEVKQISSKFEVSMLSMVDPRNWGFGGHN